MPGLFEQFPHTNLHELNLDWIIDLINQFKKELEDSAVLSVNGQTGHVTLYESENVILPALPSGVDQWRLVRMMNGQYAGILFYNGNVYLQRGNSNMRLLTQEDIPTSAGVVAWNGRTGIVNVTGADIPVDNTADADSILQALETERVDRTNADNAMQNSINTLNSKIAILSFSVSATGSLDANGFLNYARAIYAKLSSGQSALVNSNFAGTYSIAVANRSANFLVIIYAPSDFSRIFKIVYRGDNDVLVSAKQVVLSDLT